MSSAVVLLIVYFAIAIGVSFACSVFEAVLLSVRRTYLERLKAEGSSSAQTWEYLLNNRSRALAAILILNTVAHTFGAAGVGAQAAVVFKSIPVSIISAVLTLLILVFSEIIPKTLGASYAQQLAPACGMMLRGLIRGIFPLVWLSEQITRFFEKKEKGSGLSREEVAAMVQLGMSEGTLDQLESRIIRNLIRLQPMKVRDIMTPRTVVFMAQQSTTVSEYLKAHADAPFSRIPIYGENRDDVTGFVLRNDILLARAEHHEDRPLSDMRRELEGFPETTAVWSAFEELVGGRDHMRAVIDEHGGIAGVVTLEDVVETLLGMEIVDEADKDVDMRERARRLWRRRAATMGIEIES